MFIDEHGINTYGVKLIAGRNYTEDEVIVTDNYDELSKVTVVTKTLLDELFPDGNGLGQTVYFGDIPMKINAALLTIAVVMAIWISNKIAPTFERHKA